MSQLAFVFPGQGSQHIGMLDTLYQDYAVIRDTFDEAEQVLSLDLWTLCQNGPEALLNDTEVTQPLLLTAGTALYRLWLELTDCYPSVLAGHSLGEYTALVASESLKLSDALLLVQQRAQFMKMACPEDGAMAAVLGLSADIIDTICAEINSKDNHVTAANYNSPMQTVISGHEHAVLRAIELAKERGAKRAVKLNVSVASHCELMLPAAVHMADALAKIPFKTPLIPVLHNVNVTTRTSAEQIRHALCQQLSHPVQWSQTISHIGLSGVETFIESGPSNVLSGLIKRIHKTARTYSLTSTSHVAQAVSDVETPIST